MKKTVNWPAPKVTSAKRAAGSYGSFKEFAQKADALAQEQERAQEYLGKAFPVMLKLLEYRLRNQEPLIVMRPLRYQTSEMEKSDDPRSTRIGKFVDRIAVINPGTQLVLKAIDPTLQEFVFEDAQKREYALNFVERNNLMTQTDIYETVRNYLEKVQE
jgi:hypothetical protein